MTPTERAALAAAWESAYWRGTCHTGPLNDAAVSAKNPYKASATEVTDAEDDAGVTG